VDLDTTLGSERHVASARNRYRLLTFGGAGLVAATGGVHLDLYVTGYRAIPTIGALFLLQAAAAFALASALAVGAIAPNRARLGRLVAGTGAGFSLSTLGGYLLSLWIGLFDFKEIRTTAGIVAGVIEVGAFAALTVVALRPARDGAGGQARPSAAPALAVPRAVVLACAATIVILIVFGVSVATATSGAGSASKTGPVAGAHVTIVIKNFAFHPTDVTGSPGEAIVVKNEDTTTHTLTAGPRAHAGLFNTGNVAPGHSVEIHAPVKAGGYSFYCVFHRFMTGSIDVR